MDVLQRLLIGRWLSPIAFSSGEGEGNKKTFGGAKGAGGENAGTGAAGRGVGRAGGLGGRASAVGQAVDGVWGGGGLESPKREERDREPFCSNLWL